MAGRAKSKQVAALELASEIQDWAAAYGHTQDPYLTELHRSLTEGVEKEYLASLDPMDYLPNFDAQHSSRALQWSRFLAGFRNIIIFVPVALTWAAVSVATTAFNTFVQQNSGTPVNFLQFWQDGYGLLDHFWSIGEVARLDFLIVAMVILLTALVAGLQNRGQVQATQATRLFAQNRRALAIQIRAFTFSGSTNSRQVTIVAGEAPIAKLRATKTALNGVNRELTSLFKRIGK